ncbi:neuronal-specific septin-3 isoform X2 [Cherax quadricarinatus]|uniref:neuronal-specific septin-3 isoform X2 n=1 Tax=Cherax quadricarinatus TaxID=27406 RepID=UPI00387E675F
MPQAGPGVSPVEGVTYVGIDTLQEQTRLKALRRGYTFNLLVVGRSGLGKSTFVNTLFKATVARRKSGEEEPLPSTTEVKTVSSSLSEGGVRLNLTITDTPGFGDHINNENCLSSLDVEVLQRLDKIVNVVPVVAKADTLTLEERAAFKERIRADLSDHAIKVYPLQEYEDLDDAPENMKIRERLPFAVVGSTTWHEIHGKKLLGRRSNWGLVEVENKSHNDFAYMRDMLIRTHMQDLIGSTAERHYENFRRARLSTKTTSKVNIVNGQDTDHMEDLNESKI